MIGQSNQEIFYKI